LLCVAPLPSGCRVAKAAAIARRSDPCSTGWHWHIVILLARFPEAINRSIVDCHRLDSYVIVPRGSRICSSWSMGNSTIGWASPWRREFII
jgi:hypothetical protein